MDELERLAFVGRSREGDPEAFGMLVSDLTPSLRRYCRSFFENWQDTDDAVQEVWIKVWKSMHTLKQNGAFKTWLFRMTRNVCLDRVRSAQNRVEVVDAEEFSGQPAPEHLSPEYLAVQRSEVDMAWSIVAKLPSTLKQAFVLVCLEGMTYEQAATIANTSESTIRGRVARARKAIIEAVS
ncbi:RNA polymerase sigma factor [Glutamicibacter sp. NPDC087344]|uniref:RNA polymerase sigma factor n=1 Tax=Glutamicibacter sp. NPDC087344 TaxID=3363994 RepID=UPI003808BFF5